MSFTVRVKSDFKRFGENDNQDAKWKESITQIIQQELLTYGSRGTDNVIDVYNLCERHTHNEGTKRRMLIFADATQKEYTSQNVVLDAETHFFNIPVGGKRFRPVDGAGEIITDEVGNIVAEYFRTTNHLNIPFAIFDKWNDDNIAIFRGIMKQFNNMFEDESLHFSWINTKNKKNLIAEITNTVRKNDEYEIADKKNKLASAEEIIEKSKATIFTQVKSRTQLMKQIDDFNAGGADKLAALFNDLDLIANLDKVRDLIFEDGLLQIFTHPLHMFTQKGDRYYAGSFRITVKMHNADVHFYGDEKKRGYWTSADPHPHVSGDTGVACLGNIGGTIAELAAQNQVYALAMTLIDFVESVNEADSAGSKVTRWTRINEDGTPWKPVKENTSDGTVRCVVSDNLIPKGAEFVRSILSSAAMMPEYARYARYTDGELQPFTNSEIENYCEYSDANDEYVYHGQENDDEDEEDNN